MLRTPKPTTEADWNKNLERQRELEDNALAIGGQRFRRRIAEANAAGKGSTVGAAKKMLQLAIEPLSAAIQNMIDTRKQPGQKRAGGRMHVAVRWCQDVGAETAAYITVKSVLDSLAKRPRVSDAAKDISTLIIDELRFRRFQEQAPGLFTYRMGKFTTGSYAHRARSLNAAMRYAEIDTSDLAVPTNTRVQIGTKLIDLLQQSTSLVEIVHTRVPQKSKSGRVTNEQTLRATPETLTWLNLRNDALEFLSPIAKPMVVPPLPWEPGVRGGYRAALRDKFPLVRGVSADHQRTIDQSEMPTVYEALNRIQNTAWKINRDVVELVEAIQRTGGSMAGVPGHENEPLPPKPFDMDTNEEARLKWRREAHAIREHNHARAMLAVEFIKVLSSARNVATEEAIYFPHNLDFRGRVYPISHYLSPQGDDLSRALLTFADAKPLGSDGAAWLAIHGANCLGETPEGEKVSRMTFRERIDWIDRHTDHICRVAADPFTATWWKDADKPLQFYAFCVEWSKYVAEGRSDDFVSGLPIAQDGSCNGLQHFSALLKDEIGARSVNILPMETPQDIYQFIADRVLNELERRAASNPIAATWLTSGLVTRKLTKRPTMTFGYGSKMYGFRDQIIAYLSDLETWPEVKIMFTNEGTGKHVVGEAASLMAELIWEALHELAPASGEAMKWMQTAAGEIVKNGRPVAWRVPLTNFPVRQDKYFKTKSKQIETILAGKVFKPRVYESTGEIDALRQRNSVAPNVIHSLDAATLMLTVERAAADGVEAFGVIHDSYATVAGDYSVLAAATRQSFYRLYSRQDVIASLYEQFRAQTATPDDCPAPPERGTLDIGQVLASDYFFA